MSCSTSEYKLKRTWLITVVVLSCIAVGLPKHHDNLGGPYKHACVAADAGPCSQIGKGILQVNGSAVDAAIAAMFCIGVINMHSAGIGGGGFMLVYSRRKKSAEVFDLRETAAYKATEDMFKNASYNSKYSAAVFAIFFFGEGGEDEASDNNRNSFQLANSQEVKSTFNSQ